MSSYYQEIGLTTSASFAIHDITDSVQKIVQQSGIQEGQVIIASKHTTCAVSVNENEELLLEDIRNFFLHLAPADARYLHNDLHLRHNIPPDEPENAHAHLIAMLLGNAEPLAVHQGKLALGQYQSVLFIELDGTRERTVSVQLTGEA